MRESRRFKTSEEWLAARRIGASDVAAVLGVSPYRSPWDVWARLVQRAPEGKQNANMARGLAWEPIAVAAYTEQTGRLVYSEPYLTHFGPEDWASATPDGLVEGGGLLEVKTDRKEGRWGEPCTLPRWTPESMDVVRPDYYLQVQHQLHVTNAPWCDLAVLLPYYELRVYRVLRDPDVERALVDQVGAWYQRHVVEGVQPEVDGSDACRSVLSAVFAVPSDGTRQGTLEEAAIVQAYLTESKAAKVHGTRKARLAAKLLGIVGPNTGIRFGESKDAPRVSVARAKGKRALDVEALGKVVDLELFQKRGAQYSYLRTYGFDT